MTTEAARRLLVTAGPGYGKSALLEELRPEGGVVISAADLVAEPTIAHPAWIGVDDFDAISPRDQDLLLRRLDGWPGTRQVIAAGSPIGPVSVSRNPFVDRDATDLALTPYAIARLLADENGSADVEAAQRVADLTAGWPMLVRFAADALRRDPQADLVAALTSGPAASWLGCAVLAELPDLVRGTLHTIATVDPGAPVTQHACDAVADALDRPPIPDLARALCRAGLLIPQRRVGPDLELIMVPALALMLRRDSGGRGSAVGPAVAAAYQSDRKWLAAAQSYALAGVPDQVAVMIDQHGEDMLRCGSAGALVRLVDEVLGPSLETYPDRLRLTYADGLRMTGDPSGARRAFAPLVAAAEASGWSPGLACRVANLDYLGGQFEDALAVLDRCDEPAAPGSGADGLIDEEVVDWWATRVHVLAMLGRTADARAAVTRCLDAAERLGRPRPLAVAHLAAARCRRGTAKDLHHEQVLHHAAQTDDLMTATRALAARTVQHLADARYDLARSSGEEAVRMGRLCSPPGLRAAMLHNLGEALARTGALDEARWHLDCAVALARRLGPARAALGLVGLADLDRLVGNTERSLAGYTEAAELARGSGDVQVLVAALCGRAQLGAGGPTTEGQDLIVEARRLAPPDLLPLVLTTAGRLALARGDRAQAGELSATALVAAREVRAADLLADALELSACLVDDPADARPALAEARSLWSGGGARPAVARVDVLIGALPGADGPERSRAREAAADLLSLGIRVPSARSPGTAPHAPGVVQVAVLGSFTVTVDGREVPLPAWRSKQARTLVKILAGHRGRAVTRDRLCDLLWPDDDPARTGHRLSVLLATVRTVLDPAKAWPPDRYIVADEGGLRLNPGAVAVDAEMLLREAAHAAELLERGEPVQAREVLEHVERLARGHAFADETDEWADGLREEVRAAWGRSMRRLANLQLRAGRGPEALGIFARLLAVDPYDEQIHRRLVTSLVSAGRHGEARRAFDRWCRAMQDIDAPQPDPHDVDLLGPIGGLVLTSR